MTPSQSTSLSIFSLVSLFPLVACAVGSSDPTSEPTTRTADEITASSTSTNGFAIDGCAGRWQDATDYVGLVGTYVRSTPWTAPLGEIVSVTFESAVAPPRSIETRGYDVRKVARSCFTYGCDVEYGSYVAVPVNPAIGSWLFFGDARYIDTRAEADLEDSYAVAGIRRSSAGSLAAMCVVKYTQGRASTPFTLARIGF